jgi:hypothetical protein
MLRTWVRKRGLTTAQLAERTGLERARVKQVLSGSVPMDVDEFLLLTQALDVGPDELGMAGVTSPARDASAERPAGPRLVVASTGTTGAERPGGVVPLQTPPMAGLAEAPDALGNLPRQVLQLGFALGIDLFVLLDVRQLAGSNVPPAVLQRFPDTLPIKLEARYHAHNRPRYRDDTLEIVLSFDALYTCTFPWTAFREVRFLLPEEPLRVAPPTSGPETPAPPEPDPPRPGGGPFLRVVK